MPSIQTSTEEEELGRGKRIKRPSRKAREAAEAAQAALSTCMGIARHNDADDHHHRNAVPTNLMMLINITGHNGADDHHHAPTYRTLQTDSTATTQEPLASSDADVVQSVETQSDSTTQGGDIPDESPESRRTESKSPKRTTLVAPQPPRTPEQGRRYRNGSTISPSGSRQRPSFRPTANPATHPIEHLRQVLVNMPLPPHDQPDKRSVIMYFRDNYLEKLSDCRRSIAEKKALYRDYWRTQRHEPFEVEWIMVRDRVGRDEAVKIRKREKIEAARRARADEERKRKERRRQERIALRLEEERMETMMIMRRETLTTMTTVTAMTTMRR